MLIIYYKLIKIHLKMTKRFKNHEKIQNYIFDLGTKFYFLES